MALHSVPSEAELSKCRAEVMEAFKRYDKNGDGIISRDEMWALLRVLDKSGSLQYEGVDTMLSALDRNGDGLVDIQEFIDFVLSSGGAGAGTQLLDTEAVLRKLAVGHVFVQPQDEANLERCTLWELRREENSRILADAGLGLLDDPSLLVMSVGSSSTQVYDAGSLSMSFALGTKVRSDAVCKELVAVLSKQSHSRVLLLNSIGYQLRVSDPCLLPLSKLAERAAANEDGAMQSSLDLHAAISKALPEASVFVFNRVKDPATKRYKHCQIATDFTEALVSSRGMSLINREVVPDAVVDWGGASFKVYVNGRRVGIELMDANTILCEGGVLNRARLNEAIQDIKRFVLQLVPDAKHIFIAQTGKARELAIREGLNSCDC